MPLVAATFRLLSPIELIRHVSAYRTIIEQIKPDLIHALRIPYEGIIASKSVPKGMPLMISVWGNDFTLFASSNPLIGGQTRAAMRRADVLFADCARDIRLGLKWGFDARKPTRVAPGAGGLNFEQFHPAEPQPELFEKYNIPAESQVVLNPRGFRLYVRTQELFRAIPEVIGASPKTVLVCVGMKDNSVAQNWVRALGIEEYVRLLPAIPHAEMPALFQLAPVVISPSTHDGTPNSLLEAMACGCFPIAGRIESVQEWIDDGKNGLLVDPFQPTEIASAILRAQTDEPLYQRARQTNLELVQERVEYQMTMQRVTTFYQDYMSGKVSIL